MGKDQPANGIRDRIVELVRVPAGELRPNPRNWRRHPDAQRAALRAAFRDIGYADALIARRARNGSLVLIDGHLRQEETDPSTPVPVLVLDVTEREADRLLLTLDPLAGMAEPDEEALAALLKDADVGSTELQGWLEQHLSMPVGGRNGADPDEVPEFPAEPVTQPGDLWTLGDHRLLCGDATQAGTLDRVMAESSADLVFTDPPYGVSYEGGAGTRRKRERLAGDDGDIYAAFIPLLAGVVDPRAALYLWFAGREARAASVALEEAGWTVRSLLVWNKLNPHYGAYTAQYLQRHEVCFYAHRRGASPQWFGPSNEVSVWDIAQPTRNELHPTQKPVDLARRALRNSSAPGALVLDPFLGSGSTLVAGEEMGRRCYAVEIEPAYCDVAVRRWEQFTGRKAERERG